MSNKPYGFYLKDEIYARTCSAKLLYNLKDLNYIRIIILNYY
jgi:hypothetical protein